MKSLFISGFRNDLIPFIDFSINIAWMIMESDGKNGIRYAFIVILNKLSKSDVVEANVLLSFNFPSMFSISFSSFTRNSSWYLMLFSIFSYVASISFIFSFERVYSSSLFSVYFLTSKTFLSVLMHLSVASIIVSNFLHSCLHSFTSLSMFVEFW